MKRQRHIFSIDNIILIICLIGLLFLLVVTMQDVFDNSTLRQVFIVISVLVTLFLGHTVFSIKKKDQEAEDEWFALKKQYTERFMDERYEKEIKALQEECERIQYTRENIYEQIEEYLNRGEYNNIVNYIDEKIPSFGEGDLFISGNHVIDVVLSQKIFRAGKEGIHISCDIQLQELRTIHETDMNVLLSNLLDNAIEAVTIWKRKNVCNAIIGLRLKKHNDYLLISEENPCVQDDSDYNQILNTSKEQADIHGIGMKSMKRVVEKYNGSMDYRVMNGMFSIKIVLEDA